MPIFSNSLINSLKSGLLIVILKSPVKRKDLKLKTSYEGLCCNAIIDGKIMINNLKEIGKDEEWLLTRLRNNHYNDINSLALVILDSKENMTVFEKNMERGVKVLE